MLSEPTGSVVVVNVATPLANVPVPSVVEPSMKVTVPVGVPLAADTVAVSVSLLPWVIDVAEAFSVVVVEITTGAGADTTITCAAEVLLPRLPDPP